MVELSSSPPWMLGCSSGLSPPMSSSSGVQLPLLLVFLIIVSSFLLDGAHAGNLPTTINSGTFTSVDDTLLAAGTALNVASMLASAISNGKTEAVCSLLRTTFNGALTIDLPVSAAVWTTSNNIPLHLLIQDGTSGTAPRPTTYINISGVLVLGSSITIEGGTYDYSNQFIIIPSGIMIQDSSSLTIKGGTFRLHYPLSGARTAFVRNSGAITIDTNSTLAIYNDTMVVSDVSVGSWVAYTIYQPYSPITVSNTSTLAIYNSNMVVSNVNVGSWEVYTIYTSSPITISTNSTLAIYNITMTVSNVNGSGNCLVHTVQTYSSSSPITIDTNSTLAIYNGNMAVSNVSLGGFWEVFTFVTASPITVSTNSTLAINDNIMEVSYLSVGSYGQVFTISTDSSSSPITISTNSTLAIHNSTAVVYMANVGNFWRVYTIFAYTPSPITISTSSTFAIYNMKIVVSNMTVSGNWEVHIVDTYSSSSPITIDTNSTLAISNSNMAVSNVSLGGFWEVFTIFTRSSSSPITISTNSTLAIYNSTTVVYMVNVGSFWRVYTIFTHTPSPITISTNSTLVIYNSNMAVSNVRVGGSWNVYTIYTSSPITVDTNSTLAIYNSNMVVSNALDTMNPVCVIIKTAGTLEVNGVVEIADNVVKMVSGDAIIVQSESSSQFGGTGVMLLRRNEVNAARGLMITVFGTLGTSIPTIYSCLNVVNGTICTVNKRGVYSCADGADSKVNITDCLVSRTVSQSATHTSKVTASLDTKSASLSTPESSSQKATRSPGVTASLDTKSASLSTPESSSQKATHTPEVTASFGTTTTKSLLVTLTTSLPATPSVTSTPSISASRHTSTLSASSTASGCEFSSSVFYTPCAIISRFSAGSDFTATTCSKASSKGTGIEDTFSVLIPFDVWRSSSSHAAQLLLEITSRFGPSLVPRGGDAGSSLSLPSDDDNIESVVEKANKVLDGSNTALISLLITYTGFPTLSRVADTIRLPTHEVIRCPINTSGKPYIPPQDDYNDVDDQGTVVMRRGSILGGGEYPLTASIRMGIRVELEAARPILPILNPAVATTVTVSAIGAAVSGMPSALVRGGMVSSLQAMMRCSEYDPSGETGRINNPLMLSIPPLGPSPSSDILQYKRGSVVFGLAVVGAVLVMMLLSAVFQLCVIGNVKTMGDAISTLRIPSSLLPIALLVGEVSSGSAVTLLVYRPPPSSTDARMLSTASIAIDAVLAIVVLLCTWAVFIYYAYSSTLGCKVTAAPVTTSSSETDDVPAQVTLALLTLDDGFSSSDGDSDTSAQHTDHVHASPAHPPLYKRVVCYLLEPTHEPSLHASSHMMLPDTDDDDSTNRTPPPNVAIEEFEVWLQRHYFFVAERRWIAYGAAEALLGSLVDIIEGIPVTSRSLTSCAFPPAMMAVILLILLVLLVWKWPFAVRIQQWSGLTVVGLLWLSSILVTVNVFVTSLELEDVSGYILIVTSLLISFFTVVDVLAWLLMLFPGLGRRLGLVGGYSLGRALTRIREDAHETYLRNNTNMPTELATLSPEDYISNGTDDRDVEGTFNRVAFQTLAYRLQHHNLPYRPPRTSSGSPKKGLQT